MQSSSPRPTRLLFAALVLSLTASIVGQNLFDPAHAEFAGSGAIVTSTLIPRSARVQLVWRY